MPSALTQHPLPTLSAAIEERKLVAECGIDATLAHTVVRIWQTVLDLHVEDASLVCSSLLDGHFEVFVLDSEGALWHRWWWREPGWSEWEQMSDTPRLAVVAAGSHDHNHQELIAIDAGGVIMNRWNWLESADGSTFDATTWSTWSEWHPWPLLHLK